VQQPIPEGKRREKYVERERKVGWGSGVGQVDVMDLLMFLLFPFGFLYLDFL